MKKIMLFLAMLCTFLLLASCGNKSSSVDAPSTPKALLGAWKTEHSDGTLIWVFADDGKCKLYGQRISGYNLTWFDYARITYEYDEAENTLTLSANESSVSETLIWNEDRTGFEFSIEDPLSMRDSSVRFFTKYEDFSEETYVRTDGWEIKEEFVFFAENGDIITEEDIVGIWKESGSTSTLEFSPNHIELAGGELVRYLYDPVSGYIIVYVGLQSEAIFAIEVWLSSTEFIEIEGSRYEKIS